MNTTLLDQIAATISGEDVRELRHNALSLNAEERLMGCKRPKLDDRSRDPEDIANYDDEVVLYWTRLHAKLRYRLAFAMLEERKNYLSEDGSLKPQPLLEE